LRSKVCNLYRLLELLGIRSQFLAWQTFCNYQVHDHDHLIHQCNDSSTGNAYSLWCGRLGCCEERASYCRPENWQATGVKSAHEGILTKPMLLTEIENMELMAAERWTIILENTARITGSKEVKRLSLQGKASSEEMLANHFRNQLAKIPKIHSDIHQRLDEYNAKLKDGILMNLASKLIPNAN